MSRNRLSWKNRRRQAGSRKQADPYAMNQERTHVPVEDYMIGDPAEWAEEPVSDLGRLDGTDRNEIGLPDMMPSSMNHKDVDSWNSEGPYDNERMAKTKLAKMQRHFEKKAFHCVNIAQALFPTASEDVIAEQALDFMPLPDDSVIATSLRLEDLRGRFAGEDEEDDEEEVSDKEASRMLRRMLAEEEEKEEEDDEKEVSDKEASRMLRRMLAEEGEEEEEEEEESDKEASTASILRRMLAEEKEEKEEEKEEDEEEVSDKEASRMLRRMLAEEEEKEEDEEEESDKEASIRKFVAQELAKLLSKKGGYDMMEDDMDSMMDGAMDHMMNHGDMDMMMDDMEDDSMMEDDLDMMLHEMGADGYSETAELDIDLEPALNNLDSEALLQEDDAVLQDIMSRNAAPKSKKASGNKGVSQLGRVKESSSTGGSDLSNLWESAPDVSKVFSS